MELAELIKRCQKAEEKAQRALLEQYTPYLFSVCLRYSRDRAEAQDIHQDTWIRIFNNIDKYKHEGKFEGWAAKIAINIALRKKSKISYSKSIYVEEFFEQPIEEYNALESLQYDDLLRLINQLPDACREVFKLNAIDGFRHKEIGEILGINESTSRAHLTRAKQLLRNIITSDKLKSYGR